MEIKNKDSNTLMYLNGEVLQDRNTDTLAYFRDGRVSDRNSDTLGYINDAEVTDRNTDTLGYLNGHYVTDRNSTTIGYVENGRITDASYNTLAYFDGEAPKEIIATVFFFFPHFFKEEEIDSALDTATHDNGQTPLNHQRAMEMFSTPLNEDEEREFKEAQEKYRSGGLLGKVEKVLTDLLMKFIKPKV